MHFLRYAPILKLNLVSLPVGKNPVTLSVDEVEVPIGIIAKPLRVLYPGPLAVVLDTLWERRLRVRPVIEGDLADGYVQGDPPISTPDWVTLKGPRQILLGLETVFTSPINLEGQDRTLEVKVPLNLSEFKLVRAEPETVTVAVTVEAMAERTLDRIQVKLVDAKRRPGTTWEPQTIRLVVQGKTQEMSKLRERTISAVLDVTSLSSGTYELPARIEFPKGFVLKSASPEHFKVVLR
jgi:YbbR domain-containing protein